MVEWEGGSPFGRLGGGEGGGEGGGGDAGYMLVICKFREVLYRQPTHRSIFNYLRAQHGTHLPLAAVQRFDPITTGHSRCHDFKFPLIQVPPPGNLTTFSNSSRRELENVFKFPPAI